MPDSASLPDEKERLAALYELELLGSRREERLDRITRLACQFFGVTSAAISLVAAETAHFCSVGGLDLGDTPRSLAFCSTVVAEASPLIVPDMRSDERFKHSPLVTQKPHVRFYAGVPLYNRGHAVASFCLIDFAPRPFTPQDLAALVDFAAMAQRELEVGSAIERVKDQLISVIGHELRTPLTAIRGALGLLRSGALGELPASSGRMLDLAADGTERLVDLVNDILDIERLEAGTIAFNRRPVELASVVERAAESLAPLAAKAQIALAVTPGPGCANADAERLIQVVKNLVGNAIKFSPPGSRVRVAVSEQGNEVVVEVVDEGSGLPPGPPDQLFNRFHQADSSDTRPHGGPGLGLAICREIVRQHEGRIWAEGGVGVGATFRFALPLAAS